MQFFRRAFSRIQSRSFATGKAVVFAVILLIGFACVLPVHAQQYGVIPGGDAAIDYLGTSALYAGGVLTEVLLSWAATAFNALSWMLGRLIILVLGTIIIPILGYNGFGSSGIVTTGWTLVRDVVNMFVIVILLLIAIQTIVGSGRIDWRQQLPRFLLGVIAVNFSKTITLLVIDLGQVVLFTFVNALSDVAAGNFINLFQISASFELKESGNAVNAVAFLGTAVATSYLLALVLGTLVLLALAFLYRIVLLWVLIIISPAAFFLGGVGDTLKNVSGTYQDWWKRLAGAVTFGPILAFFLWLALASASAGSIAASEGFNTEPSPEVEQSTGLLGQVFEQEEFLSVLLAVVLIMVGFQAASAQSAAAGGLAGKLISREGGSALARGIVTASVRGTATAARSGVQVGRRGAYTGIRLAEHLTEKDGKGIIQRGAESAAQVATQLREGANKKTGYTGRVIAGAGRTLGSGISAAAGGVAGALGKQRVAEYATAKKANDSLSDIQRMVEHEAATGEAPLTAYQRDRKLELQSRLATNGDEQKALKDYLVGRYGAARGNNLLKARLSEALAKTSQNEGMLAEISGDDKYGDKLFKSKVKNMHLLQGDLSPAEEATLAKIKDPAVRDAEEQRMLRASKLAKMEKLIGDEKFKPSMLSEAAVKDEDVRKMLQETTVDTFYNAKTDETIDRTGWDLVRQGKGIDPAVRREASKFENARLRDFAQANAEEIKEVLANGVENVNSITEDHVKRTETVDGQTVQPVLQGLVDAAAQGVDLSQMTNATKTAFNDAVQDRLADPATSPAQQTKLRRAMFAADDTPDAVVKLGLDRTTGNVDTSVPRAQVNVLQEMRSNPTNVYKFSEAINAGTGSNDASRLAVESLGKDTIKDLARQFDEAATPEIAENVKKSITAFKEAVQKELAAATPGTEQARQLGKTSKQLLRAEDYVDR